MTRTFTKLPSITKEELAAACAEVHRMDEEEGEDVGTARVVDYLLKQSFKPERRRLKTGLKRAKQHDQ